MARQKKNVDIVPNGEIEPTKNTQEEIEAALARACGQVPPTPQPTMVEKVCVETENNAPKMKTTNGTDPDDIKIPELSADQCAKIALENQDRTIYDYIVAINNKIEKECNAGGFSTNVTLCVMPNHMINVQHILDWYRIHGFIVTVDEIKHPQYGVAAGTMEYNFNISWACAQ